MLAKAAIKYPMYRRRSELKLQDVVLHHIVGRGCFAVLEDRAQLFYIICQMCSDLRSNCHWSEHNMCMSDTQWLLKSSQNVYLCKYRVRASHECLLLSLRTVYSHQNLRKNRDTSERDSFLLLFTALTLCVPNSSLVFLLHCHGKLHLWSTS